MEAFDFVMFRIPAKEESFFKRIFSDGNENAVKKIISRDSSFLKSIYLSNSELFNILTEYIKSDVSNPDLFKTLYKYISRISTRPTPFGSFAGFFTAEIEDTTHLEISQNICHLELDIVFRQLIFEKYKDHLIPNSRIFSSNGLFQLGDCLRYFEKQNDDFQLSIIELNEDLNKILVKARNGISYQELINDLEDINSLDGIINELIQEKILVSDLNPTFYHSSAEWLAQISKYLPADVGNSFFKSSSLIRENKLSILKLERLKVQLTASFLKDDLPKNIFYSITKFNTKKPTFSKTIIEQILTQVYEISPLFKNGISDLLENFKTQFYKRYDNSEVPILLALDPEHGINYGMSQSYGLDEINLDNESNGISIKERINTDILVYLYKKALTGKSRQVEIPETLIPDLSKLNIPDSFYILGNILAKNSDELDAQDFNFHIKNISGGSPTSLMARFAMADDDLQLKLENITNFEQNQNPEAIMADIIYLPEGPVGNVLVHPPINKKEIPYYTIPSAANENRIELDDLMVSVRNGRTIILWSKKLNKRIIPRLPNAHNFQSGLPLYRFLADLQFQENSLNFSWDWGIFNKETFLPRIYYKKLILSKARWIINKKNEADVMEILPRFVIIKEFDNELVLDLKLKVCKDILKQELLNKNELILEEYIFNGDKKFIKRNNRNYTSEIIIPVKGNAKNANKISSDIKPSTLYPPGSEWLFLKIYTGAKYADDLLKTKIKKLISKLESTGRIQKWFFVRFNDPDFHLRIRLKIDPLINEIGEIIGNFHKILENEIQSKIVYKIQIDSYLPETERYSNMDLAESIFHSESKYILSCISKHSNEERLYVCLISINAMLNAHGLNLPEKISFCEKSRDGFLSEYKDQKGIKAKLNAIYREERNRIEFELLEDRSEDYLLFLQSILKTNALSETELSSFIHMQINRFFISNNREIELRVFHLLFQHFRSQLAKSKVI